MVCNWPGVVSHFVVIEGCAQWCPQPLHPHFAHKSLSVKGSAKNGLSPEINGYYMLPLPAVKRINDLQVPWRQSIKVCGRTCVETLRAEFCMCLNAAFHYDANYLEFSCFSLSFSQTCCCTFASKHNCRHELLVMCRLVERVWRWSSWQVSLHKSNEYSMNYPHQGEWRPIFLHSHWLHDLSFQFSASSLSLRKGKCFR